MNIPVFVSCPTTLSSSQEASRQLIIQELVNLELEPRALGRSDYPTEFPLREVAVIARHCSGAVILGFEQFHCENGVVKRDTSEEARVSSRSLPTPWNHLEAGIMFGLRLPMLVFRESLIRGGIFDDGVTEAFVHLMPSQPFSDTSRKALRSVFLKWQARVRNHYYSL